MAVLLYRAETWRTTTADMDKLDAFHRKYMIKILKVFWPNQILNEELYHRTNTQPLTVKIKIRRWRWIGHVLRRGGNNIARTALDWAPEGKLKKTRQTSNDLEEKRGEEVGRNGLDLMGRCNNSCKRSRGVESNFEWPQASSGARRG